MPPNPNPGGVTTDLAISRSSVARSITRITRSAVKTSIPGLAELSDIAKALIEDWKTAGCNENQLSKLATRVEGLCSLIHDLDPTEYSDVSKASRKLHEIKGLLTEELERQSRSGIIGAEQKQRLLDSLKCEVDSIVETILLRLTITQAQSKRHNPMDNFRLVSAHEITDTSVVYEWYPRSESEDTHQLALSDGYWPGCDRSVGRVWRGRLGKTSVIYRTYRPRSDSSDATKAIENELKCLSRCLHPNIASVMGITKGYDGVSGYVLFAGEMSIDQFMLRVDSGASLVRCIQGFERTKVAVLKKDFPLIWIAQEDVTVKPNGHFIVSPTFRDSYSTLSDRDLYGFCDETSNPATWLVLEVYTTNNIWRAVRSDIIAVFLGDVAKLGRQMFTVLEVTRLAAKYRLFPKWSHHCWEEASAPPFAFNPGDIGYSTGQDPRTFWTPIKLSQVGLDSITTSFVSDWYCNHIHHRGSRAEGDQWISVDLCVYGCADQAFAWIQISSDEIPYERARQERASLRDCGMEVEGMQFCMSVELYILIRQIEPTKLSPEPLHFHRNPSIGSDTRAFWGFLSTSPDPCSPGVDPAEVGLKITYEVRYQTACLSDFWDYRYEKMLQSGLASMPGGYPGSYIEEVEEDEAD